MKRFFSFLLILSLISVLALPAAAAESNFIELLDYSSVNDSGNMFQFSSTITVELDVPMYTILRYIDMTFTVSDNTAPTSVKVKYNNSYQSLTVKQVTTGIYRAYGTISGYYDSIFLQFNAIGSQYYTIQSCKVSSVTTSAIAADVDVNVTARDFSETVNVATFVTVPAESTDYAPYSAGYQALITVYDPTDYDTLYVYGSVNYGSINSIRCTYGGAVLPCTLNYIDVENAGEYNHETGSTDFTVNFYSKYIYSIEIDLTGIDRNQDHYCLIYISGSYASYTGLVFNCQGVTGSVLFADTEKVSWWNKFTDFMSGLFGGQDPEADDFGSTMESQSSAMQDAVDQMDQVNKPDVGDIDVSLDQFMTPDAMAPVNNLLNGFFGNDVIVTMLVICLTCALVSYILFGKR